MKKECQICNKSDGVIDVHHKDKNRENNCKNNLQILCHSCHTKIHYDLARKNKQSKMLKGNKLRLGKKHSDETKKKIGKKSLGNKSMSGKKHLECSKEKIRKSRIGKTHSENVKKKMSEARKLYWKKRKMKHNLTT